MDDFFAWVDEYIDTNQADHGYGVCWEYLNGKRHMCFSDMCGTYSHPTLRVSKSGDNRCRVRFSRAVKSWRNAIKAIGGFYFDDRTQSWINSSMTTQNRELASLIDNSGNVTATGNLTVSGTTTAVSSTNTTVTDPLMELNNGAGSNSNLTASSSCSVGTRSGQNLFKYSIRTKLCFCSS